MFNVDDKYVALREVVDKKVLTERDCVYVVYLLTIIIKKMQCETKGGGHFNVNPDTVLIQKIDGEEVKVKLLGEDTPHKSCNGKPDFDTGALNQCCRAPETYLGRFSPASDVYSMGMLLAYMILGGYPYKIDESMSKGEIQKVVKETEPQLKISESLDSIIIKAIDKIASKRFKEAEEMGFSLMDYLGMERSKRFRRFDDAADRVSGVCNKDNDNTKKDMQDYHRTVQKPHVDVAMSVRVGDGFKAVAGMEDIKKILRRDFIEIVSHRELAKEYGIMPSNMLFYGAPGTGKTYISMKLAEECGLDFCLVKPSDLGSIWLHGSQGLIKELFQKAEAKAKKNKKGCILLIDELDALCGARDAKGNEHQADEVAEWLTQLNDCVEKNVFVIGTTNCLDRIEPAVIRHGRIDQILYVGLPDLDCRKQLFEIELSKRPHEADIDMEELAKITDGYTSSDISYMVKETARNAFEASIQMADNAIVKISEAMLRDVVKATRPSVTRDEVRKYERMRDEYVKGSNAERPKIGFLHNYER